MSRHRELKAARDELIERAGKLRAYIPTVKRAYAFGGTVACDFADAYDRYEQACADLDAAGGAGRNRNSVIAAKTTLPSKGSVRLAIVQTLVAQHRMMHTGMTISELKARLRKEHSTVSAALNYLVEAGWVRDSGETRMSNHRKPAAVWVATEKAIEKVTDAVMGAA